MKNVLGTNKKLQLFGASGELRYDYFDDGQNVFEIHYNEIGEVEKKTTDENAKNVTTGIGMDFKYLKLQLFFSATC